MKKLALFLLVFISSFSLFSQWGGTTYYSEIEKREIVLQDEQPSKAEEKKDLEVPFLSSKGFGSSFGFGYQLGNVGIMLHSHILDVSFYSFRPKFLPKDYMGIVGGMDGALSYKSVSFSGLSFPTYGFTTGYFVGARYVFSAGPISNLFTTLKLGRNNTAIMQMDEDLEASTGLATSTFIGLQMRFTPQTLGSKSRNNRTFFVFELGQNFGSAFSNGTYLKFSITKLIIK